MGQAWSQGSCWAATSVPGCRSLGLRSWVAKAPLGEAYVGGVSHDMVLPAEDNRGVWVRNAGVACRWTCRGRRLGGGESGTLGAVARSTHAWTHDTTGPEGSACREQHLPTGPAAPAPINQGGCRQPAVSPASTPGGDGRWRKFGGAICSHGRLNRSYPT